MTAAPLIAEAGVDDLAERRFAWVRANLVGDDELVWTPYGLRRLTYADHTASGRALAVVEDAVRDLVLPDYGNPHTDSSHVGRRTTALREQARAIVRAAVGGDASTAVIFCGSGSTAAVDKLVGILGLRLPAALDDRYALLDRIPREERPVVFVGPYEHHSNELAWRESIADVVAIPEDVCGGIDTARLAAELDRHRHRPLLLGAFSAGSNVTGVVSDVPGVTGLLHRAGALACWDYAAAGPHRRIAMAPDGPDAVFLSPHKLPGGPGASGVLAVRRALVRNRVPTVPGGGTVSYVSPTGHRYCPDVEAREEGGTPAVVGDIRAGLAFRVRETVGVEAIAAREGALVRRLLRSLAADPRIEVLGDPARDRLGLVSFLVRAPAGARRRYLHHNFVVAVLSDLFGIQARGGCSCAGPYGHRLLAIDARTSRRYEEQVLAGHEGLKPGWVRLSVSYYTSDAVAEYVREAVHLVAALGHRLLPHYVADLRTGLWRHRSAEPPDVALADALDGTRTPRMRVPESALAGQLEQARRLLADLPDPALDERPSGLPLAAETLRWFVLP